MCTLLPYVCYLTDDQPDFLGEETEAPSYHVVEEANGQGLRT